MNDLYWEGFDATQIPFEELPDKFVIKVVYGSGFNIICTDKSALDKEMVINKLNKWLDYKFLPSYGEWFYGVYKPRIIIEKFLDNNGATPDDYKVFSFHGTQIHCNQY